jgi:hypothetical protein
MVFKTLTCLVQEKKKYKVFLLASYLKIVPKYAVLAFLRSHWSIFSGVHSWPALVTIFRIAAAFRNSFRVTGGYRKVETCSLKRVTGRIFTISK